MNQSFFKSIIHGILLGVSLIAPGFSAATMALILGIYEFLINLLSDLFSANFLKTLKPISALAIGAGAGILLLARLINQSIEYFPYYTRGLFLGLIIATVPLILKQSNAKNSFTSRHYTYVGLAALLTISFNLFNGFDMVASESSISLANTLFLLLSGGLVTISMLLPGLSGSLMLMLLGVYEFILHSISSFDFLVLGIFAIGGILGLIISGKLIKNLLETKTTSLYSICLGLVIGSIPVMINYGIPSTLHEIVFSLLFIVLGYISVTLLNRLKT